MTRVLRGPAAGRRVVPAAIWSAEEEASAIRSRAHRDARAQREEIAAAARAAEEKQAAKVAEARRQAEEKGFVEGRRRGEAQGLRNVFEALGTPSVEAQGSSTLVSVVVDAASALLGESLEADPDRVAAIVARTMDRVRRARSIRVEVHPEDVSLVERVTTARGATLSANASFGRGDCVVRTNLGTVDGRLTTRLTVLRDALENRG